MASKQKTKVVVDRKGRKLRFNTKLASYLHEYKNILICGIDNVGSNQMQKIRLALRGKAVLLMGKNTMCRKVILEQSEKNKKLENLVELMRGNVGLCFTNEDLTSIRKVILENKVPAAAKSGTFAPADVFIPPGPTGLDPGQTSFFQALNIATKIAKGSIEIINEVHLIKKGEKINSSSVALLTKMDKKPFYYSVNVKTVYEDGTVYGADVLDMTPQDILGKFVRGAGIVAALSLKLGLPTLCAVPHMFSHTFQKLVSLSLASDYEFEQAKKFKELLANPVAAAAAPVVAAAPVKEEKKEEEKKEEEEGDMGMSLFD